MSLKARLDRLVEQLRIGENPAPVAVVVIYDPISKQPLAPIDQRAELQVWIPDNGRGDTHTR